MKLLSVIFIAIVFLSFSCSPDDDINIDQVDDTDEFTSLVENDYAYGYYPETETPYIFVDHNLHTAIGYDPDIDGTVDYLYIQYEEANVLIDFDPVTKLPTSVATSDDQFISFFYNEELTRVDISVENADGTFGFYVYEADSTIATYEGPESLGVFPAGKNLSLDDFFLTAGAFFFTWSAIQCMVSSAVAVTGAPLSAGLATALFGPAAIKSCVQAFTGLIAYWNLQNPNNQILPNVIVVINVFSGAQATKKCGANIIKCLEAVTAFRDAFLGARKHLQEDKESQAAVLMQNLDNKQSVSVGAVQPCTESYNGVSYRTGEGGYSESVDTSGNTCWAIGSFVKQNGAWVSQYANSVYGYGNVSLSISGRTLSVSGTFSKSSQSNDYSDCLDLDKTSTQTYSFSFTGGAITDGQLKFSGSQFASIYSSGETKYNVKCTEPENFSIGSSGTAIFSSSAEAQ